MQTPFDIFRLQQKKRKEMLHQSLSPKRQGVSFSVQNGLRPKTMQSQSKTNFHNKQNKNVKSAFEQIKLDLSKVLPQQKCMQRTRSQLKKSQHLRLSFTKSHNLKGQYKLHSENNPQKRVLIIEGNHYNKDLIQLNKKKLEELINKIQSKSKIKFKSNMIEQAHLGKQKITRLKKREKNISKPKEIPKVQGHKFQSFQEANKRKSISNSQNHYSQLFPSENTENEFEVTNYLQCNSLMKQMGRINGQMDSFSLVLDSSKVLAFLKNVKKLKQINQETEKLINSQKSPLEQRLGKGGFYSCNRNSKLSLSERKRNQYEAGTLKNSYLSAKTSRIKTKINGMNFQNLQGWESTDETQDLALTNFSFLQ